MRDSEESPEDDTNSSHDHVSYTEERILAPNYRSCGDHDGLGPAILGNIEIWNVSATQYPDDSITYLKQCLSGRCRVS